MDKTVMSDKKYSVFISSTFEDLERERNSVLRAILEYGHFPLGMELWGAANDQQWNIISRQIDVADYYLVIVAQKYGSVVQGVSWTEREYDYAVERGVPVLGFVLKDGAQWSTTFIDKADQAERLEQFKHKVKSRPVSFWSNTEDLRTAVILALGREIQATARVGWVRASEAMTPTTANEIARLSEENAKLRSELAAFSRGVLPDVGFDVVRGTFHTREDRDPDGVRCVRFETQIFFDATLRSGASVGFAPRSCNVMATGLPGDVNLSKISFAATTGSTISDVKIDGPKSFQISASTDFIPWREECSSQEVRLMANFKPFGYDAGYSLPIPMLFERENDKTRVWSVQAKGDTL
jgi:hypothetical protein